MLDNGYSLSRVEILNWGNFYGYQKFQLKDLSDDGLLFAPPAASAILGVNGSGKSTLIDGIMITLLPFENSLKLGVTNDLEVGSGGGRTIKDYVLGKHSSTHSSIGTLHGQAGYGRKDGCSIFMLVFQHNRNVNKFITLGRIWWFLNYQVNETHLAFIGYDPLRLNQFLVNNESPKNSKIFRNLLKETFPHFQVYDVMQSYFTALSSSFGNISKEDLKILNRACYVKSISQIDQFIRENMLLEQENPHLERLLENVRNGKEIALAIQSCERKIGLNEKILRNLDKLKLCLEKKKEFDQQLQLSSYYANWIDIEKSKETLAKLKAEVENLERQYPIVQKEVLEIENTHKQLQVQISQSDLESRLQKMDIELQYLNQNLTQLDGEIEKKCIEAKQLNLKLPNFKIEKEMDQFAAKLPEITNSLESEINSYSSEVELLRNKKYNIELLSESLKAEIKHLSETKSLIPHELYSVKEMALQKLKIPQDKIFFVGELIQVKPGYLQNRKAIESALFPISRNILVHPDYLNVMTQWLDQTGLKSDVVVKRISSEELLSADSRDRIDKNDSDDILKMIDILPDTEHDFGFYLKKWLEDVFDYQLVSYKDFKSKQGKLVTSEGLVKTDSRTMRKLKSHFSFSLGWDNQELLALKTKELVELQEQYSQIKIQIEVINKCCSQAEEKRYFLKEFKHRYPFYREFPSITAKLKSLSDEKKKLLKENPGYEELKSEENRLYKYLKELQKKESQIHTQVEVHRTQMEKLTGVIPEEENRLMASLQYQNLVHLFQSKEILFQKLTDLKQYLFEKKLHRLGYEADLKKDFDRMDIQAESAKSQVSDSLNSFKMTFEDPNLPFLLPPSHEVLNFAQEWEKNLLRLQETELPKAQSNWKKFFDQILIDSVKDMINEIKAKLYDVEQNITSINEVLKLTNFEDLMNEKRYLRIHFHASVDERIRRFKKSIQDIEKLLGAQIRNQIETNSEVVMKVLVPFVEEFQTDLNFRNFVTDVRNHFHFEVHSLRRAMPTDEGSFLQEDQKEDQIVEVFSGAKKDAKSSAQTTHLAYTLLASCLSYRFKFNDPQFGQETPRILILDEFGGKFDNEKPKDIIKLLDQMGFQSILVSPMSKADLLAGSINQLVFVHKVSATHSKVRSIPCSSKEDYDRLLSSKRTEPITAGPS